MVIDLLQIPPPLPPLQWRELKPFIATKPAIRHSHVAALASIHSLPKSPPSSPTLLENERSTLPVLNTNQAGVTAVGDS
jgi:hypothetical protein